MAGKCVNRDRVLKSVSDENFSRLLDLIENIQYGTVTLIIQDGRVIQIDRNEKIRLI